MDVLDSAQDLIEEVLRVLVREVLPRINHTMEVGFHQLGHDVHVLSSEKRQESQNARRSQSPEEWEILTHRRSHPFFCNCRQRHHERGDMFPLA